MFRNRLTSITPTCAILLLFVQFDGARAQDAEDHNPQNDAVCVQAGSISAARHKFDLLHDALKANYEDYLNTVWSSFGFLVLAIGWILTSDKSRRFLADHARPRYAAEFGVGTIWLSHLAVLFFWYRGKSDRLLDLLEQDCYATHLIGNAHYYDQFAVSFAYASVSATLTGAMFFILLYFIFALPGTASNRTLGVASDPAD